MKTISVIVLCILMVILGYNFIINQKNKELENVKSCEKRSTGIVIGSEYGGGPNNRYLKYKIEFLDEKGQEQYFITSHYLGSPYNIGDQVMVFYNNDSEELIAFSKEEIERINQGQKNRGNSILDNLPW
jgi:hypothetical protein